MKTLDRYLLTAFAKNLALVLLTLVALYGLIEFIEKVDDLLENQAAWQYYLLYPLHLLPVILSRALPMAVLLATFATVGGLSRTSQLTAMFSGGISVGRIARPLFLGGLVLAVLTLVANLWLVPWSFRQSDYLLRIEIRGGTPPAEEGHNLYFRDGQRIVSVGRAFPTRGVVLDLTIVDLDDHFMPLRRIHAARARHEGGGRWRLLDVIIRDFQPGSGDLKDYSRSPELPFDLGRQPTDLLQLWDRPEDLTINELLAITAKLSREGYDPKAYRMEAQMRFAGAAIPIVMVLLGIPFARQQGRHAGLARGIVTSLAIFAVYFFLHALFSVFGAIAVLPPLLAAWAANLLMALVGTWFLLHDGS